MKLLETIEDKLQEYHLAVTTTAWCIRHNIYYFVRPSGFPKRIRYTIGFTAKDLANLLRDKCDTCYFAYVATVPEGATYIVVGHYPIHATVHVLEHGIWSTKRYYVSIEDGRVKPIPTYFKLMRMSIVSEEIKGKLLLKPLILSYKDGLSSVVVFQVIDAKLPSEIGHGYREILETMEPRILVSNVYLSKDETERIHRLLLEVDEVAFTGKTIEGLLLGDVAVHLMYTTLSGMKWWQ